MNMRKSNIVELTANAVRTSTLTGSAVDVQDYDSYAQVILTSSAATAGTTPTLDVKLQDSADGSTGWADITGATFDQVTDAADVSEMIEIDISSLKRYVRVVGTIGGTSTPTFGFAVSMLGVKHAGRNASQKV